jgi:hypothetical protein
MAQTVSKIINEAAENSSFKLVARACMIIALPLGGFIGTKALDKIDKTNESTIRQEETLRNIVTYQLPAMTSNFDSRFNAQAARLDDAARRIGKLEDWRLTVVPQRGIP